MDESIITLEFEDGETMDCEILGSFELEGKDYIALLPCDEEEGDEALLFGYTENGDDGFELIEIEDDEEFERVADEFDRIMEELE